MNPLQQNWREIAERVNAEVNALPQVAEQSGDFWKRAGAEGGDCEDLALAKLDRLLVEGFPIERLRLATCFVGGTGPAQRGEAHVVLVVDAPDDHYVLDNLQGHVVPVYMLIGAGYVLESVQKVGGSREWVEWRHA